MEQAPEDQGPQREPYNEWALELLEFIHFRIGCQHSRIGIIPRRRVRDGSGRS
uniref:Vpr protein n=1 Tax=Human immunodeficiency virus type 1 TaxID=11676 RepID=E2DU64_HV1|nr:vpr protein [Human immunodeficiency virus 1]